MPDLDDSQQMIAVFEAATELEAQMMLDLLARSSIEGQLSGNYLSGGYPGLDIVKVLVPAESAADARHVIAEWEAQQATDRSSGPNRPVRGVGAFILGAVLATAVVTWFTFLPLSDEGGDFNRDGKYDQFFHWTGDRLARMEADRNFDGDIDMKLDYDNGVASEMWLDNDFDGHFESKTKYRYGNPDTVVTDLGGGRGQYRQYFENSVLVRAEFVTSGGRVIREQFFSPIEMLQSANVDTDGDGKLDTTITYGMYEEEVGRAPYVAN